MEIKSKDKDWLDSRRRLVRDRAATAAWRHEKEHYQKALQKWWEDIQRYKVEQWR